MHTETNTENIQLLLAENTETTNLIHDLTRQVHDAIAVRCGGCGAPLKPGHRLLRCPYCEIELNHADHASIGPAPASIMTPGAAVFVFHHREKT